VVVGGVLLGGHRLGLRRRHGRRAAAKGRRDAGGRRCDVRTSVLRTRSRHELRAHAEGEQKKSAQNIHVSVCVSVFLGKSF